MQANISNDKKGLRRLWKLDEKVIRKSLFFDSKKNFCLIIKRKLKNKEVEKLETDKESLQSGMGLAWIDCRNVFRKGDIVPYCSFDFAF